MPRSIQTSLSGGELSPSLHSHADLAKYQSGLALCENWFALAQGGISTRAGFQYINQIHDITSNARLINFQFNTEQSYALVFTHQKMRVIRNGATVLEPNKTITGATAASPVVITTSAAHGYATGDDVYISGVGGMTEINGRFFRITVTGATTFELALINGSGYTAYTSGGVCGRVFTLTTPYTTDDVFNLKYTQSADVMTITEPNFDTRDLTRTDHHVWTLSTVSFASAAAPPSAGLATAAVGTASGSPNKTYRYVLTTVDEDGDESIASAIQSHGPINALNETYGVNITWTAVAGADYYNVYKEFSLNSGIFGWIGEAKQELFPSFTDYNFGPDMSVTPPLARNPIAGANNRPSCTTYHQQRRWFGATFNKPATIWATRTADYDNMDVSRPTRSDDAIEATIAAQQVNEIRHMISLDDLLIFTSGAVWKAEADQDGVLTPANINFRTQNYRGASHVPPVVVGDTALYVEAKGSRIRDIGYTFETDTYTGKDLSVLSRHMFEGYEIVDWCYAQEPYSIVWAVRSDGQLLSLTYLREHDVYAWTRHVTDGTFESVCAVSEGDIDAVYAVVRREVGAFALKNVERMYDRRFPADWAAFCVDSGLTYWGPEYPITSIAVGADPGFGSVHSLAVDDVVWITGATGMEELNDIQYRVKSVAFGAFKLQTMLGVDLDTSSFSAYTGGGVVKYCTNRITGLHHLIGKTVSALADGNVETGMVVASDGSVTLSQYAHFANVGLPYNCDFQTLEVSFPNFQTQSRKKQVARLSLRVLESRGLSMGKDADHLFEVKERTPEMNYTGIMRQTGEIRQDMLPGWSDFGQVYVRQAYPLPATVLAVIPETDVSD